MYALVGAYQWGTRDVFWNPGVIVSNTYAPFFRVNSVFWDPSVYGRYLAVGMVVALAAYLPLVLWLHAAGPALVGDHGAAYGLVVLWLAFHWFMVVRGMTLWWRARGDHWMVTGTR